MITLVDYLPDHMLQIGVQEKQSEMLGEITKQYAHALATAGIAYTVMLDNRVLACGGKAKQWEGRWILWAVLSREASRHMLRLTKITKRTLELHNHVGRLEAIVRSDFEQAHRWVKMLGLKWHHHEERFLPGGLDADIYVRFS